MANQRPDLQKIIRRGESIISSTASGIKRGFEGTRQAFRNTFTAVAPALIGLANSSTHNIISDIVCGIVGGGIGYLHGKDKSMNQAAAISGLVIIAGLVINVLTGSPQELTTPIMVGSFSIAIGEILGAAGNRNRH